MPIETSFQNFFLTKVAADARVRNKPTFTQRRQWRQVFRNKPTLLDRDVNSAEMSRNKPTFWPGDRGGNRDEFSEIRPISGQMCQQRRVFINKPTFWTEVATEAIFHK